MVNIMIKGILENSINIDKLAKCVTKSNLLHAFGYVTLSVGIFTLSKMVSEQEEKINELENRLEEIELKGE